MAVALGLAAAAGNRMEAVCVVRGVGLTGAWSVAQPGAARDSGPAAAVGSES